MFKHKRGYVRADGKVLIRRKKGVEIWGEPEQLERIRRNHIEYMDKKRQEYRNLPQEKKYKIGDFNPETGLYFIRRSGNLNAIWGTKEDLLNFKRQRSIIKEKYVARMKEQRSAWMEKLEIKRRRGDIDPILNLVFFKYNYLTGAEIWYDREKFNYMCAADRERRRNDSRRK